MITYTRRHHKLVLFTILSFIAYVLSNGECSISILAWVYPILFMFIIDSCNSSKVCFIIFGVHFIGFIFRFVNVIGMNLWLCAAAGLFIAALTSLPYLFWHKSKRNFKATAAFAAEMVIVEYLIYRIYPILGGLSDSYTQYKNISLLQIVTITGIYGITFIMYWTAAVTIWLWGKRDTLSQIKKQFYIYCTVIGLVLFYGSVMSQSASTSANSVRIAGVTVPVTPTLNEDKDVYAVFYTDSFTNQNIINTKKKLSTITDALFQKTMIEAQADADIVFWSELNGAVLKEDEAQLLQRASDLACEQGIYLVVSLLVKTPYQDLKENKTVAFNPQGLQISEYYKFGRSIGELCLKGDGQLKSFDTEHGRIAPFICSDMAFSSNIQQAGKNNVDIIFVPASDWKEMTQIAIKTAIIRGVENGCNVIRHTNNGISVVSDVRGTILAQANFFQSDTKTLAAQVLTSGRFTVYSHIGNVFVYLCILYLSVIFLCHLTTYFKDIPRR